MKTQWSPTTKYIVGVGFALAAVGVVYLSRSVLGIVVAALILSFLTYPIVRFLNTRWRFPLALAAITAYLLVGMVLAVVPIILTPPAVEAVRAINVDAFFDWIQDQIGHLEENLLAIRTVEVFRFQLSLAAVVDPILETLVGTTPREFASLEQVLGFVPTAFSSVTSVARYIATTLSSAALALFLTVVMAIYLSIDARRFHHGLIAFLPEAYRPEMRRLIRLVTTVWSAYFRGQLTVSLLLGGITYIGAAIVGLPGAFILALIASVLNLIPNLGPILSVIPALIVALVQGSTYLPVSNLTFALIVAGLYLLIQQLESNVVTPRIVGHATDLPPVIIMAGVVTGTTISGLLGAVLAAPVIATARVLAAYCLNKIFDRDPFCGLEPAPREMLKWGQLADRARRFAARAQFAWRYWRNRTPWDTNVTPPELVGLLEENAPGRALDLGCGTGTNCITLARQGWQVTGIDFVRAAIRTARRKAAEAGLEIDFRQGDVTNLDTLTDPVDLALDIGCLFSLPARRREQYAAGLARLVRRGGRFLLYAWLPRLRRGRMVGLGPDQVTALFALNFEIDKMEFGEDQGCGAAWYWLTRR